MAFCCSPVDFSLLYPPGWDLEKARSGRLAQKYLICLSRMSYSDKDKAREHWNKSKDDANAAGQHAASAASTIGHDVRAAAGEAAQAGKYAAGR